MADGPLQSAHWLNVTLYSIGDAVIATDAETRVTFMNPVAESLTGWNADEATGQPLDAVFHIVNEKTRQAVESPVAKALREGVVVGLANHTVLIAKDGVERSIDDSAAPIRDEEGNVAGVVLVFRDISERKQYEQTIQDALNYATNIISTLRHPFLVLNKDLCVVSANRSFFENFQVPPKETHGKFVYDLGNGQWDIPALRAVLDEVLSNNHPVLDYEVEHDFPTIGEKIMLLNARRIRKPGNHSELILLAIEDVTQQKRAERELILSENQRRLALESAELGAWHLDPATDELLTDERFRKIFGATGDRLAYEEAFAAIHPDDRDRIRQAVADGTRPDDSVPYVAEYRVVHPDGAVRWVFAKGRANFEQDGAAAKLSSFDGTIADVTQLKESEEKLYQSEQRYRRLFESARDGILILNAENMRIVDSNPFMHELLGYTHEQLQGKELWEIGLFQDISVSQEAVRNLKETGYIRYEDLPLETGEGSVREVEFVCNLYQEDGHHVAQCNIRDITQRKAMERRIQDQAKELAQANRRKDEFLAMLSHELRNPMAPMLNALQLIGQAGGENELQREARGVMERQVRHLSRLVDDLLEVSRITTGRIHLHVERADAGGIVRRAVERLEPQINLKKQELSLSLPEEVLWLEADTTRLEEVVGNLLNNASKYNSVGGQIWLSVEPAGDQVVIRVQDNGIGMAPEILPDVFDLFSQADRSLDRSQGGLGIGLALVKNLVVLHRGTVEARSEGFGQGSEFVVRLPLAPESSNHEQAEPAPPTPETPGSLRVLIVDDNADAAKMSALLLRSWGHEVRVVYNGPDAIKRAAGFRPHSVLCDIGLPEMDGYEVARLLRQDHQLPGMLLAAVTGYGQESDRERSKEAGFDVHLVKPVESAAMKQLLAEYQAPSS